MIRGAKPGKTDYPKRRFHIYSRFLFVKLYKTKTKLKQYMDLSVKTIVLNMFIMIERFNEAQCVTVQSNTHSYLKHKFCYCGCVFSFLCFR